MFFKKDIEKDKSLGKLRNSDFFCFLSKLIVMINLSNRKRKNNLFCMENNNTVTQIDIERDKSLFKLRNSVLCEYCHVLYLV